MKRASLMVAVSVFAVAVYAGGLSKYKGWDHSPQGDLMTAEERAQWASVTTDEAADKFVKDFLARRGPDFVAHVNQASTAADKYFTTGKRPGSMTERGKLVIILGPPSALSVTDQPVKGHLRTPSNGALSNANTGEAFGGGGTTDDYAQAASNAESDSSMLHVYTFTYSPKQLPARFDGGITVAIEVDPGGRERIDRKTQDELSRLYEMVAQSKVAQPPAKP